MNTLQYNDYNNILQSAHTLIAGTTGSGKSVLLNSLVCVAMRNPSSRFVMIDLKKVELIDYKRTPSTITYADTVNNAVKALKDCIYLIEKRFDYMQKIRVKKMTDSPVYIVIDELADLMTTAKKQVMPLLQRIAQIGRAANIHILAATQCPITKILPTELKVNFTTVIGLRTRSAQDSRNIIGVKGCEELPRYGECYISDADGIHHHKVLDIADESIQAVINWNIQQNKNFSKKFLKK